MTGSAQQRPQHMAPQGVQPAPTPAAAAPPVDTGDAIATLLIEAGHLTPQQLTYAKRVQAKLATHKTLLHVLQELQYVPEEQLRQTLSANPTALRLGDLLVELEYIQKAELEAALSLQKEAKTRKKLGEILVENHFIDARKLAEVLAYQLGMPYVEPQFAELDKTLLSKGPLRWYTEHTFLPIHHELSR